MTDLLPIAPTPRAPVRTAPDLRAAAQQLEVNFLAEMLKSAGVGKPAEGFSGGIGEDQFGSFQRQALAQEMVRSGGVGMAETFYQSLLERQE